MSSSDDTLIQVESVGTDKAVGLKLVNDARTWMLRVLGYNIDEFVISDGTSQPFRIEPGAPSHALRIHSDGDVTIGTGAGPTANSGKVLAFGDNVNNPTMATGTAGCYAKGSPGVVDFWVGNDNGDYTKLTAHDDETGEFVLRSHNGYTGRRWDILFEAMARKLEELTGETFILEDYLPEEERRDWNTDRAAEKAKRDAELAAWEALPDAARAEMPRPEPFVTREPPPYIAAAMADS